MKRPLTTITALAAAALLSACSYDSAQSDVDACAPRGKNLLEDVTFSTLSGPRSQRKWLYSEHAAGQTFEYSASDGILKIHKMGGEPWFLLSQSPNSAAIAGKRITFGAEFKLDLQMPTDHAFTPGGGLALLARRGGKVVINSSLDHQPRMGKTDWIPISITEKVPPGTDSIRVGFLHQAEGTLRVRRPFLKLAASKDCLPQ
ncbi:hypothetical protein [Pseudohalioglobus lutimaris]|uniref:Uncharacterized protein n=1 Tax=Pseudohalioglobus lutimaris TaxID=1737061 RepID=A0A2N5X8D1_9GAMM|nr:hypothetical protein [Pseudohalioglobus lutimaris]PLW70742.1 hypothetical protein C0039_01005 [Pseudohalioglobus lutimaris]